ncbi:RECEPTOR GID1 putative-RELATED [Salix purpurea]|uniref:RECEPTOR GID1 putative-RELATED n=1 Tax=Salix purpurea TaxID=77065 RepID=A0A9Q0PRA3_SALPP|nr:RECEPTOR GID1 putative-RELATED [Salix purpurea]
MCASLSLIPSISSGSQPSTLHRTLLSSRSARSKSYPFFTRSRVSMDSSSTVPEVAHDFPPFFRIYKDGHIERLSGTDIVPCGLDPETNVLSKDAVYSPELNLSSRLYRPHSTSPDKKLPVLVYYHGGGFLIETPFSSRYHGHLNSLVKATEVIAISVDYRLAPEHPLPIAYDDSWTALEWVASHVNGDGPEEWLNSHADFGQVFLAGDSAGANIAHKLAMRCGQENTSGVNVTGVILVHPYFGGKEPIGTEVLEVKSMYDPLWQYACPASSGLDDPLFNPLVDPELDSLGCRKVLVIIGGKDFLRERGWHYYEKLSQGGWDGVAEIMEGTDDDHVFHLGDPTCENAVALLERIAAFISNDNA